MGSRLWAQGQEQGDQEDQEGGCVMVQEGGDCGWAGGQPE